MVGVCAGVAGAAFGSLDAFGLQLANMNRATSSREQTTTGVQWPQRSKDSRLRTVTEPPLVSQRRAAGIQPNLDQHGRWTHHEERIKRRVNNLV
jgi:hypothetical protein